MNASAALDANHLSPSKICMRRVSIITSPSFKMKIWSSQRTSSTSSRRGASRVTSQYGERNEPDILVSVRGRGEGEGDPGSASSSSKQHRDKAREVSQR
ncbi:hypothetical protein PUN28_008938 [Cardiocondyla obscurior]|uniref:Uncharacterized protein n=1 Tax=Cardiocondyla obscurior TaxID=286306 RepID=A0AAW2FVF6_9HYME